MVQLRVRPSIGQPREERKPRRRRGNDQGPKLKFANERGHQLPPDPRASPL